MVASMRAFYKWVSEHVDNEEDRVEVRNKYTEYVHANRSYADPRMWTSEAIVVDSVLLQLVL